MLAVDPETDPRFLTPGTELTVTYTDDDYEPGKQLAEHKIIIR